MSASLVGSEMCIRDRAPPPSTSLVRSAAARLERRMEEELGAQLAEAPGAVSYTHLTLPTICSV
eukprot:2125548-Alexandrium_andersonii.AAC.1